MTLFLDKPELLVGFRKGEREVLAELFAHYVDEVAALVRRGFVYDRTKHLEIPGVRDSLLQNDLVQETFVRAFSLTTRTSYDGVSPFRYYLMRIAKNLLIDEQRRRQRGPVLGLSKEALQDNADAALELLSEDPALVAHHGRQQEAARRFAESLNGEDRRFYELRYTAGMAQREVAASMNITRRRVRTLEQRLQNALRCCLEKSRLWP